MSLQSRWKPPTSSHSNSAGQNTFVSFYAFSLDPSIVCTTYSVTVSGNLLAAASWIGVGELSPPDCGDLSDPLDDTPGNVTYAPFPTAPEAFTSVLWMIVPAPGASVLLGLGGFLALRRRR